MAKSVAVAIYLSISTQHLTMAFGEWSLFLTATKKNMDFQAEPSWIQPGHGQSTLYYKAVSLEFFVFFPQSNKPCESGHLTFLGLSP